MQINKINKIKLKMDEGEDEGATLTVHEQRRVYQMFKNRCILLKNEPNS